MCFLDKTIFVPVKGMLIDLTYIYLLVQMQKKKCEIDVSFVNWTAICFFVTYVDGPYPMWYIDMT